MKRLFLFLYVFLAIVIANAQNRVIVSENFENVTDVTEVDPQTKAIGKFRGGNYSNGAASWVIGVEQNYPLAGSKSAHVNVTNAGTAWWNLQFKLESNLLPTEEQFEVTEGKDYIIEFKIQSSIATNTSFYVFDTHDFNYPLELKGGYEVQTYSIQVDSMHKTSKTANFCIGMGNPSVPTEFWIDDFVVYEVQTTSLNENNNDNFKVWSSNMNLLIETPEECSIIIYNSSGQRIMREVINIGHNELELPQDVKIVFVNLITKDNKNNLFKVVIR